MKIRMLVTRLLDQARESVWSWFILAWTLILALSFLADYALRAGWVPPFIAFGP